jgi:ketosteroid isomerase-like protein
MRLILLGVGLLVASAAVSASAQTVLSDTDETRIQAAFQAFSTAATTDQVGRMGPFFTEDAVWMPHAGAAVHGREKIQEWFTVRAVKFDHTIEELAGAGDIAYTRASFTLVLDIENFKPCDGDALAVWKRGADGAWLIHNYAQTFDEVCTGTAESPCE